MAHTFLTFKPIFWSTLIMSLNDSLQQVNVYVDDDGALHFVDSVGADSVLPFNSLKNFYSDTAIVYSTETEYEIGFKPKFFILCFGTLAFWYYEPLNAFYYQGNTSKPASIGGWDANNLCYISEITETGFTAKVYNSYNGKTATIIAFG